MIQLFQQVSENFYSKIFPLCFVPNKYDLFVTIQGFKKAGILMWNDDMCFCSRGMVFLEFWLFFSFYKPDRLSLLLDINKTQAIKIPQSCLLYPGKQPSDNKKWKSMLEGIVWLLIISFEVWKSRIIRGL